MTSEKGTLERWSSASSHGLNVRLAEMVRSNNANNEAFLLDCTDEMMTMHGLFQILISSSSAQEESLQLHLAGST